MGELSYIQGISAQEKAKNCDLLHQKQYIETSLQTDGVNNAKNAIKLRKVMGSEVI